MSRSGSKAVSPSRSLGAGTPVAAPRRSLRLSGSTSDSTVGRLSNRASILSDNTYINAPGRKSWWKRLERHSVNIEEVFRDKLSDDENFNIENIIQTEQDPCVAQPIKPNLIIGDLSDTSSTEDQSIIIKNEKINLFVRRQTKKQADFRVSLSHTAPDKTDRVVDNVSDIRSQSIVINTRNKNLFRKQENRKTNFRASSFTTAPSDETQKIPNDVSDNSSNGSQSIVLNNQKKSLFSKPQSRKTNFHISSSNTAHSKKTNAILDELSDTSVATSKSIAITKEKKQLFGMRQNKKQKAFRVSIMSESDEESIHIQPKLAALKRNVATVESRRSSRSSKRALSPDSVHSETIELSNWKMLPSSTMIGDDIITCTPAKKLRRESNISKHEKTVTEVVVDKETSVAGVRHHENTGKDEDIIKDNVEIGDKTNVQIENNSAQSDSAKNIQKSIKTIDSDTTMKNLENNVLVTNKEHVNQTDNNEGKDQTLNVNKHVHNSESHQNIMQEDFNNGNNDNVQSEIENNYVRNADEMNLEKLNDSNEEQIEQRIQAKEGNQSESEHFDQSNIIENQEEESIADKNKEIESKKENDEIEMCDEVNKKKNNYEKENSGMVNKKQTDEADNGDGKDEEQNDNRKMGNEVEKEKERNGEQKSDLENEEKTDEEQDGEIEMCDEVEQEEEIDEEQRSCTENEEDTDEVENEAQNGEMEMSDEVEQDEDNDEEQKSNTYNEEKADDVQSEDQNDEIEICDEVEEKNENEEIEKSDIENETDQVQNEDQNDAIEVCDDVVKDDKNYNKQKVNLENEETEEAENENLNDKEQDNEMEMCDEKENDEDQKSVAENEEKTDEVESEEQNERDDEMEMSYEVENEKESDEEQNSDKENDEQTEEVENEDQNDSKQDDEMDDEVEKDEGNDDERNSDIENEEETEVVESDDQNDEEQDDDMEICDESEIEEESGKNNEEQNSEIDNDEEQNSETENYEEAVEQFNEDSTNNKSINVSQEMCEQQTETEQDYNENKSMLRDAEETSEDETNNDYANETEEPSKNKRDQCQSETKQGRNSEIDILRNDNSEIEGAYLSKEIRSSSEGSGWNSHTTAYLQRKSSMYARKSLRTMVLDKASKSGISNKPIDDSFEDDEIAGPSLLMQNSQTMSLEKSVDSPRRTQTKLLTFFSRIADENLQKRRKIEQKVMNDLRKPLCDPNYERCFFLTRSNSINTNAREEAKNKKKESKRNNMKELKVVLDGKEYKPPKLFKPPKASWITTHLYKYLESKLQARYGMETRNKSERFVQLLYEIYKHCLKRTTDVRPCIQTLQRKMALMGIIDTYRDFYTFVREFMPKEFALKTIPNVANGLPVGDLYSNILEHSTTH